MEDAYRAKTRFVTDAFLAAQPGREDAMRRPILALLLSICACTAAVAAQLSLNAGNRTFSISWLDGFTYTPAGQSQRWRGPNDELVIATVAIPRGPLQDSDIARTIAQHTSFAETKLPGLAAAKGSVTKELTKEQLSSGATLYSTATQTTQRFKDYYYLQFFHISPQAEIALFTVEGFGQSTAEFGRYRPLFDSAKWIALSIPTDSFTERAVTAFQKSASVLKVTVKDGDQLELQTGAGPLIVNLDNIRGTCTSNPARCDEDLSSF